MYIFTQQSYKKSAAVFYMQNVVPSTVKATTVKVLETHELETDWVGQFVPGLLYIFSGFSVL